VTDYADSRRRKLGFIIILAHSQFLEQIEQGFVNSFTHCRMHNCITVLWHVSAHSHFSYRTIRRRARDPERQADAVGRDRTSAPMLDFAQDSLQIVVLQTELEKLSRGVLWITVLKFDVNRYKTLDHGVNLIRHLQGWKMA